MNRLNVNPRGEGRERVTLSSRFFSPFPHTESPFTGYKPFFYEKGTPSAYLLLTNGASSTYLLLALWTILQTHMTDFPTLSYTSTSKIPTLWCTWSLEKVPLSGGASLYRPLWWVQPPSLGPPEGIRWSHHTDITPRKGVDSLGWYFFFPIARSEILLLINV